MTKQNSIPVRTDPKFAQMLDEIKLERIKIGKDNPLKPTKNARLTLALTRVPEIKKIKQRMIDADLP